MKNTTFTQVNSETFIMKRAEGFAAGKERLRIHQAFAMYAKRNDLPYAFIGYKSAGIGCYVIHVRRTCQCCGK
jgi:hypothetical protein